MKIDCRMEKGPGKREIEDRILVGSTILAGGIYSASFFCKAPFAIAVADGVGGNRAGNIAAHLAVEGLIARSIIDESALAAALRQINAAIVSRSRENPAFENMASTLSGLYFTGEKWLLYHIGNSRVYCYDAPYLKQLTTDHTVAHEMLCAGFSDDEIRKSGNSSAITACLGNGDIRFAERLHIADVTSAVNSGQLILLTSDGVHDFIPNSMLERGISSGTAIPELLCRCMQLARERGSADDLSMAIISFTDGESA